MQGCGRDGFCDHGVEAVYVQTVEVLGWDNEGDIAVKRFLLVLQFKLTPARDSCHGRGTMIVCEVFRLTPFNLDFLLRCRFIEIDLHSNLKLAIVERAIGLIKLFAG